MVAEGLQDMKLDGFMMVPRQEKMEGCRLVVDCPHEVAIEGTGPVMGAEGEPTGCLVDEPAPRR